MTLFEERLAKIADEVVVIAAVWDPLKHPRARNGRFIEVGGWVRGLFRIGSRFETLNGKVTGFSKNERYPKDPLVNVATKKGEFSTPISQIAEAVQPKASLTDIVSKVLPWVHTQEEDVAIAYKNRDLSGDVAFVQGLSLEGRDLNGILLSEAPDFDPHDVPDVDVNEPPLDPLPEKGRFSQSAGVVITEPDGRIWMYEPKNHFGGYEHTFSKGRVEEGDTVQQAALREAYEELGLVVKITGYLGDYEGSATQTRLYTGERIGGAPWTLGTPEETHNVKLVAPGTAKELLNVERDQLILADLTGDVDTATALRERARKRAELAAQERAKREQWLKEHPPKKAKWSNKPSHSRDTFGQEDLIRALELTEKYGTRQSNGFTAASARGVIRRLWDEALHPRGKDGKFIDKHGFVRGTFTLPDGTKENIRGEVIAFAPNVSNPDDPVVQVKTKDGGKAVALASQVSAVPMTKAELGLADAKFQLEFYEAKQHLDDVLQGRAIGDLSNDEMVSKPPPDATISMNEWYSTYSNAVIDGGLSTHEAGLLWDKFHAVFDTDSTTEKVAYSEMESWVLNSGYPALMPAVDAYLTKHQVLHGWQKYGLGLPSEYHYEVEEASTAVGAVLDREITRRVNVMEGQRLFTHEEFAAARAQALDELDAIRTKAQGVAMAEGHQPNDIGAWLKLAAKHVDAPNHTPEMQALITEYAAKQAELVAIDNNRHDFQTAYAAKAREVLAEVTEGGLGGTVEAKAFKQTPEQEQQMHEMLAKTVGVIYPSWWIQASNDFYMPASVRLEDERAYYNHQHGYVVLPPKFDNYAQQTFVHEFGHRMEHTVPGLKSLEFAFYWRRNGKEFSQPQTMNELVGAKYSFQQFKPNELARPDEFANPYMGKDYGAQVDSFFEIFTMGAEQILTPEIKQGMGAPKLIAEDADYRAFILGAVVNVEKPNTWKAPTPEKPPYNIVKKTKVEALPQGDRIVYHATKTDNVDSILRDGLKVSTEQTLDPVNFTWFGTSQGRALSYLNEWGGFDESKTSGVILAVRVPPGVDPQVGEWESTDDMGFTQDIPPSWIIGYETIDKGSPVETVDLEALPPAADADLQADVQDVAFKALLMNGVVANIKRIERDDNGMFLITTVNERIPSKRVLQIIKPKEDAEVSALPSQEPPLLQSSVTDYGGLHQPSEGPRIFDLLEGVDEYEEGMLPSDVYDNPEWYTGYTQSEFLAETMATLKAARNKPDAMVTVYRAGPVGDLDTGNWVTLSKSYAVEHAKHPTDPAQDMPVHSFQVPASEVRFAGDDLMEYGYWGVPIEQKKLEPMPPDPGTAPIPEGMVRLYHYTNPTNMDAILSEGLRLDQAKGESYGEPNWVWASAEQPDDSAAYVEFYADPLTELDVGRADSWRPIEESIAWMESHGSNVTMLGDVPPERIVSHNRPWHATYRYLRDEPTERLRTLLDEWSNDTTEYGRGVVTAAEHLLAERDASQTALLERTTRAD